MRLRHSERDVLEAIDRADDGLKLYEVEIEAGWCQGSSYMAVYRLRSLGYIHKPIDKLMLTERGKILLAVARGKERKTHLIRAHRHEPALHA